MNNSWNDQKNYLCKLIKQINTLNPINDLDIDIEVYCDEIITNNKDDLSIPIKCFENVLQTAKESQKWKSAKS